MTGQLLSAVTKFAVMYSKKVIMGSFALHVDLQVGFFSQLCADTTGLSVVVVVAS
jgi:hypothetical protein